MKEKILELYEYYQNGFFSEHGMLFMYELDHMVATGQCVMGYIDFMIAFGNTDYDWVEMKRIVYYEGIKK